MDSDSVKFFKEFDRIMDFAKKNPKMTKKIASLTDKLVRNFTASLCKEENAITSELDRRVKQAEYPYEDFLKLFHETVSKQNVEISDTTQYNLSLNLFRINWLLNSIQIASFYITKENAKTAPQFLFLAQRASSKSEALKFVNKAIELDESNIDAKAMYIMLTAKTYEEKFYSVKKLFEKSTACIKEKGFFSNKYIGNFFDFGETRSYMQVCKMYLTVLYEDCRMNQAAFACKEMLKLDESDELGVRHYLMHIYAWLEDEESAEKLHKNFSEDWSVHFNLPLCLMYYKIGKENIAKNILEKISKSNKDTKKFFREFSAQSVKFKQYFDLNLNDGYRAGTVEELIDCVRVHHELYVSCLSFAGWCNKILKSV